MTLSVTHHPSTYYRESRHSTLFGTRVSISGEAVQKSHNSNVGNLQQYISGELAVAASRGDGVEELSPLKDGDGIYHRYFLLKPSEDRFGWRMVAFGEEDDFYISFRLTAMSEEDRKEGRADFEKVVAAYRKDIDMCAVARGRWRCDKSY